MKEGFYLKNNDIIFENIEELADYLICEVENYDDKLITVVAKFDEAKEILKNVIILSDDVNFELVELESPIIDNYEDEFVLSFWNNSGVIEIGCEKSKDEDGEYIDPCGDIVFLFDNCNSKIISLCEDSDLYFVSIDDGCSCDSECDECCCGCCDCDDDNIYGFELDSKTDNRYSKIIYYNLNPINKPDIYDILRGFGF